MSNRFRRDADGNAIDEDAALFVASERTAHVRSQAEQTQATCTFVQATKQPLPHRALTSAQIAAWTEALSGIADAVREGGRRILRQRMGHPYESADQAVQELVVVRTDGYTTSAVMDPQRLARHAAMVSNRSHKRHEPHPVAQATRLADVERCLVEALREMPGVPEHPSIIAGIVLARLSGWSVARTAEHFGMATKRVQKITRVGRMKMSLQLANRGLIGEAIKALDNDDDNGTV